MAVPKAKTSKARRDKRRSNVWKLEAPGLVKCSHCGEYTRPHHVCEACGFLTEYRSSRPKTQKRKYTKKTAETAVFSISATKNALLGIFR